MRLKAGIKNQEVCTYKKVCAYKKGALNNLSLRYTLIRVGTIGRLDWIGLLLDWTTGLNFMHSFSTIAPPTCQPSRDGRDPAGVWRPGPEENKTAVFILLLHEQEMVILGNYFECNLAQVHH